jgi:DNA-binding XRE family transcriptional regulator
MNGQNKPPNIRVSQTRKELLAPYTDAASLVHKEQLGNALRKARENRNLTQEQLAERINKSSKTIANYESGKFVPKIEVLAALANSLECHLDDFVTEVM